MLIFFDILYFPGIIVLIVLLYIVTKDDFIPSSWKEKRNLVRKVSREILDLREKYGIDIIVHTKPMYKSFIETGSCFSKEITGAGYILI